ncbi:DUF559 domain-containing protein [Gordonia sp. DT219]|uniref:DUF559 domain-containing protein n=2 Tax=unclassified Gordonia (in: high G+C Gram-positive bacteria) TaxID=2657482 RepID=UPI003CEEF5F5
MQTPPKLRSIAFRHDGVFTAAQARECGITGSAVTRRVRNGLWIRHAHNVYRLADHPFTARTKVRLMVLESGQSAVLSGAAAAWWHGIGPTLPKMIPVTVPRGARRHQVPGVKVKCRTLDDVDIVVKDGLRVTAPALSALEGGVESSTTLIDRALQLRKVRAVEVLAALDRRRGCTDAPTMAKLVAGISSGARSAAEREVVALFNADGLTGWEANLPVVGYEVDFGFPASKVAVEIDGMAFHRDANSFQYDRKRRNDLVAAGWIVLNFTWADIVDRPDYVLAQVRHALRQAAA